MTTTIATESYTDPGGIDAALSNMTTDFNANFGSLGYTVVSVTVDTNDLVVFAVYQLVGP